MVADEEQERIRRMHRSFLKDPSTISIERAKYYTEKWRETEADGLPIEVRVALCVKHVFENMGIFVHPDDRIAGTWTENRLGVPLDIERGLFNEVMEIELGRLSMLKSLLASNLRFVAYAIRRYGIMGLYRSLKYTSEVGAAMPSTGLKPINRREINPYCISPADRKLLQRTLLPYWKGRNIADILQKELADSGIFQGDMLSFSAALPSTNSRNETILSPGAALGVWQGHVILDHEKYLRVGVAAMLEEVREAMKSGRDLTAKQEASLSSQAIALEGVLTYAARLRDKVSTELESEREEGRRRVLSGMLKNCTRVPDQPAKTFREAVQSYWTVKNAVDLALPFNVNTPGRLDQVFYPYYEADLREGRIAPDEACALLQELFLKVMSHNMRPYSNYTGYFASRYEGSEPVTLGGLDENGADATNELTYVMLDAAEQSKAVLNFAVRFNDRTPDELYMKVADIYYNGTSSLSMLNDDICIKAMEKRGYPRGEAAGYAMASCVDLCVPGKTGSIAFSAVLLCRILDITLRSGDAQTLVGTVAGVGLDTGDPDGFASFDELVDAYVAQVAMQIGKIAEASRLRDRLYEEKLPAPYLSAFIDGCLQKRADVTAGGGVYDLEGILFMNSIANTVDSLYVIKKCIFERRSFTFRQLLEAIDCNFEGFEGMLDEIMGVEGKWGNGNPEADAIAREVTTRIFEETFKYRTHKGGFIAPFVNSMTGHTYDGRICIATPDGRRAGKPFASSCTPYNVDEHGPTGVLRSVAAIDFSNVMGAPVNLRMHPSAIGKSDEARRKWVALIRTYFDMGGEQIQPTVVSTELLKSAREHPEGHLDIIVKVGGYSACFVDLGHEIQDEIISRSEHTAL